MNDPHIVIMGNPVDGFYFRGPFENYDAAEDWGDDYSDRADWWIAPLKDPKGAGA